MYNDQLDLVVNDVVSLAETMPAAAYDFRPPGAGFAGTRNFGEQVKHLVTMIYITGALTLEENRLTVPGRTITVLMRSKAKTRLWRISKPPSTMGGARCPH